MWRPVLGPAVLLVLLLSACYRATPPPRLDGPLAITIDTNRSRLIAAQGPLQQEVARACRRDLGWRVDPTAAKRLVLTINDDDISATSHGDLGIARRWRMEISGTWTLHRPGHDPITGRFSGSGHAARRDHEANALRAAAANAADAIAAQVSLAVSRKAPPAPP